MTKEKRALVEYRMERAIETLDEAKLLFEAGHVNAYINRLYYACFYAVSALLMLKDYSTSKHSYLRSLLHREFIKKGVIPIDLGKHYDLLFNNRQKGDYEDFAEFKADEVKGWLEQTREFVNHIETIISRQTNG